MQITDLKKLLSIRQGNSADGNSSKVVVVLIAFGALQYEWASSSVWKSEKATFDKFLVEDSKKI